MLSYGSVPLIVPSADLAAYLTSRIPLESAFNFFRPQSMGDPVLDPRTHFNWVLARPFKLNTLFMPWGAARFGYAFALADGEMLNGPRPGGLPSISVQNSDGSALLFTIDDGVGSSVSTPMHMLPPVPLSKVMGVQPQLPLFLLPLVDSRYRFWETASAISVTEGLTTWTDLYDSIGSALGIALEVDPISADYLTPGVGLNKSYQHLPLLLDLVASSVGQRIVRRLNDTYAAINASTAQALMVANANLPKKLAGGSYQLGVVDA